MKLTGIQQSAIDESRLFPEGWAPLARILKDCQVECWFSWGRFDRDVLKNDRLRHGIICEMPEHTDLAAVFTKHTGKRRGRRGAMRHFNLKSTGQNHRALDDAHDVFQLWTHMKGLGWLL